MRLRLLVVFAIVVVGIVDAAVSREWDLLVIFAMAASVVSTLLVGWRKERVRLSVRADLARWLRRTAETTGEPVDDVVDRVVASARHGLFASTDDSG